MIGFHWWDLAVVAFLTLIPLLIALLWVRPDANRRGQPGWLWALLTLPFGWLTLLVYAFVRTR